MVMKQEVDNVWETYQHDISVELDKAQRSLKDLNTTLDQSQGELNRLTQRNAAMSAHLQQVQAQLNSISPADVKNAYSAAMETQQRLLLLRGQIEKLQSDQSNIKRYIEALERADHFLSEDHEPPRRGRNSRRMAMLEMLINAQESERLRLSRQMHDGPAQALSNFIVQAEIASRFFEMDPEKAKEELANLKASAMSTFQKVRLFISELRPMMLDDLGLVPTLKRHVETFKEQQSNIDVVLSVKGGEKRLAPYVEVMLFRAAQELLANVARFNLDNPAKVQVNLQLSLEDTLVRMSVSDNGKGFDPEAMPEGTDMSVKLIRERVEMLGGYLEVDSSVGKGSRISFQIPLETSASEE
ncbi:histidine kinase [Longilinea arvoryzae]|uniref:Oxygen sensor histidine kinase NreB n=1 Tax=Longilinea arvoryzae TaxID=360412 RepID=A0A0S7BAP3_9CHLR|nr:sensor histidine kinase [Longilinea arvoryzae]GAP14631.1 histidine kinase [Longilinea arvoryzae]